MHRGLPEGNTKLVLIFVRPWALPTIGPGLPRIPSPSCFASSWAARPRLFHSHEIACTGIYMYAYAYDMRECIYELHIYKNNP